MLRTYKMSIASIKKEQKALIQRNKDRELEEMREARKKDIELYSSPAFDKIPGIRDIIKSLKMPNKIEMVEEEDFVIRSFLRHGSATKIIKDLKVRNPDVMFNSNDIKEFLVEYKDAITKQVDIKRKSAARRIMKTKEGLTHELLDLAELSKNLALKYDAADDHTSAISAIKAASDIFFRNAKIEGLLDESTTININTQLDKMVQNVASESSSFKDAVLKVVEKNKINEIEVLDAEFVEVQDA